MQSFIVPSCFRMIFVSKKGRLPLESVSKVNLMLPVGSIWLRWFVRLSASPTLIISRTSSTYLFQSFGLQLSGAVAIASSSRHSMNKVSTKSYTRAQRKSSTSEIHKSAISEHVASSNHVIGLDEAKIIDQEPDKTTRWLKESI